MPKEQVKFLWRSWVKFSDSAGFAGTIQISFFGEKGFAYVTSVAGTVTISGTVGTPSLSGSASYTVVPAIATQLAVQLPGQSFTAGSGVSGPAPYVLSGQPFSINCPMAGDASKYAERIIGGCLK